MMMKDRVAPMTRTLAFVALWSLALGVGSARASSKPLAEAPPWSQGESAGEDLRVSLITFGPGSDVASLFGHSALLVEDTRREVSRVYNYGMFSFDRALLARYAMGRLSFWLGEAALDRTLRIYSKQGREIVFQELLLSPETRKAMAGYMAWSARPENRGYLYDHFLDNCATRPRDVIDRFGEGRLRQQMARPSRMTLRDHVRRYTEVRPGVAILFDFLMNSDVERPITVWDEAFLPAVLSTELAASGLAAPPRVVHEAVARPPIAQEPPRWLGRLFLIGAATGGIGLWLTMRARRRPGAPRLLGLHQLAVGLILGVPGLVLALMWAFTEHRFAYANENLLLVNPLTLAAAPLGVVLLFKRCRRTLALLTALWSCLAFTSVVALLIKVLPFVHQDNGPLLALALPVNVLLALGFILLRRDPVLPGP